MVITYLTIQYPCTRQARNKMRKMKKILFVFSVLLISITISAQDLESIVKKNLEATGGKARSAFNTLIAEGSMSQMGMTFELKLLEKKPDKIKISSSYSGLELIQVINGQSGYMVNPMTGSTESIKLTPEQVNQAKGNSLLSNSLENQVKAGTLTLVGSSEIAGEPVYELRNGSGNGETSIYISKKSYYTVAVKLSTTQNGQQYNIEARMKNYTDFSGVMIPVVIETYIDGSLSGSMTYKSIVFDVPIPDSEFEIK